MGIRNEFPKEWNSFAGGRFTRNNLITVSDDHALIARDLIFPGDAIAHKRPGYTLVGAPGIAPIRKIFDFQRQSDGKQFIFLTGGGKIAVIQADGTGFQLLSSGEDLNAVWEFATNVFACYASNGIKSYRFVDVAGTLTKFKWGLATPVAAPGVALAAGTLSAVNGYQYAFSRVTKWTDSTGLQRVHIGAPSPLSAHTGPFANKIVNLSAISDPTSDAQQTHWWIWRTNDTPLNTTSVLFFLAEITVGTSAFGDALADSALDTTRQAPYNNLPPPPGTMLAEYMQRIAIAGIAGKPDLVQGTGLEEIDIGIAQETAPPTVFFNVPGGTKAISAEAVFNQALMLSTQRFWFQVSGFSAETFQEKDKIFEPGAAGPRAWTSTATWLVWLGLDKKLWAWNGYSDPVEMSWKIARADGSTQLSMESMEASQLANAELRWYNFGRYQVVACLCSTKSIIDPATGKPYFDWVQLWDVTALHAPAGPYGTMTKDGRLQGSAESDMFPADKIISSAVVLVNNQPYMFLADSLGNIFRWPDGFTDAGKPYLPLLGTEYTDCEHPEMKKRFHFMDALTSRLDAVSGFKLGAAASDGVYVDQQPIAMPLTNIPNESGFVDTSTIRGKMNVKGVSSGRFVRGFVTFPFDDQDAELYKLTIRATPLGKDLK